MTVKITKQEISKAIENATSMSEASTALGMHFSTFKRYAIKYNLYDSNQGGRGSKKPKVEGKGKLSLADILEGKEPQYQSYKLKLRLYENGLKKNECENCGTTEWLGSPIECELDHIDGNRSNHKLENLRILCPNCHSQTPTFRFKKR